MKRLKETITNKYILPHRFSFITLEEFCELNSIYEDNLTDNQIEYFYNNYGIKQGLPASNYDRLKSHNDWVIENLKSHSYNIVAKRLQNLLNNYIINIDTNKLSEKFTDARIIRISLNKKCNIFNDDSEKTFKLNNTELANDVYNIINFHNYYITLIYNYDTENVIIIEPKYTEEATKYVKSNKYLYHITNATKLNSILKTGLRPKARKNKHFDIYRYFLDRIFLNVHTNNIKYELQNIIKDLGYNVYDNNYIILKIDVSKLNITFWWDDASQGNTVYTYESIPPKFIEVIEDINSI